ncbi:hypothetical protein BMS3Bbin07_01261 [bacterium BMS3Bbin07]|nr:hypothetical protein BMS3Bbin07_01261 [bacterium BMS3Bbin07]
MCILCLTFFLICRGGLGKILLTVFFLNKGPCSLLGLCGYPDRISPHIRNQANRALFAKLNPLVKLLCNNHGLLWRKSELSGGLLLKGTGNKGWRWLTFPEFFLYLLKHIGLCLQFFDKGLCRGLVPDKEFILLTVYYMLLFIFKESCLELGRHGALKETPYIPVFSGLECLYVPLSLNNDPYSNRLHTARTQSPPHLSPQERTQPVTHEPVQNPSCLLGIHLVHINLAGVFDGITHCLLCNLVKGNPVYLLIIALAGLTSHSLL